MKVNSFLHSPVMFVSALTVCSLYTKKSVRLGAQRKRTTITPDQMSSYFGITAHVICYPFHFPSLRHPVSCILSPRCNFVVIYFNKHHSFSTMNLCNTPSKFCSLITGLFSEFIVFWT